MEKNEEIATVEPFIQTELEKFEIKEEDLTALVKASDGLTIAGVDDKEGYKKVHDARMAMKKKRVEIEHAGKAMRAKATAFSKAVIARENKFVAILEPREIELQAMEDAIDDEKDRIRIAKEHEEDERIQKMSDALAAVGHAADFITLKGLTETQFADTLAEATAAYTKRKAEEEQERQRLAEENLKKEKEERERAEEQERTRLKQEAEGKRQDEERIRLETQQKELEAEKQKIEDEKKRIKDQLDQERRQRLLDTELKYDYDGGFFVYQFLEAKAHFPWTDFEKLNSEEFNLAVNSLKNRIEVDKAARKKIREDLLEESRQRLRDQEEQTRIDNEKKAKEEEQERLNQGPDINKFKVLEGQLATLVEEKGGIIEEMWTMKSKKGKVQSARIKELLTQALEICRENSKKPSNAKQ